MQPKKSGTPDFPYLDAYSTFIENTFVIECNYCQHFSSNDAEAEQHFFDAHRDIYEENYPKKNLDEKTGKFWNIPKLETLSNDKYMVDDVNFYLRFNGFCEYERQPISEIETKGLVKAPDNTYTYNEELLIPTTLPKIPKQPKQTAVKDPTPHKIKHIYSYNVGKQNLGAVMDKLKAQNVQEKDIYYKENKKGNYFIYYYK